MRIVIAQHDPAEGPGAIEAWAAERGHATRVVMTEVEPLPSPDGYDALVVLGGPMGANDDSHLAWLATEKRAIAAALDGGTRVLGVCLGAQLVASVLGAVVTRNPEPEIGWFPVTLTDAARASRVFGQLPAGFIAGHWHGDTFALPPGAVRLATSEACGNQAFSYAGGRVLGLQFHLEWMHEDARGLVERFGDSLVPAAHVVSAEEFIAGEVAYGAVARDHLYSILDAFAA